MLSTRLARTSNTSPSSSSSSSPSLTVGWVLRAVGISQMTRLEALKPSHCRMEMHHCYYRCHHIAIAKHTLHPTQKPPGGLANLSPWFSVPQACRRARRAIRFRLWDRPLPGARRWLAVGTLPSQALVHSVRVSSAWVLGIAVRSVWERHDSLSTRSAQESQLRSGCWPLSAVVMDAHAGTPVVATAALELPVPTGSS